MGKALIALAAVSGLVMALILFAVIGSEEPPPCAPAGSTPQVDVRALTYPSSTGAPMAADVYLPQGAGAGSTPPRPMLVLVHGGGFFFGDRHELDQVSKDAAAAGYIAVNIDYNLTAPRWPTEPNDVRAAIAWARTQAPQWGGDPAKMATWGDSAGGNLAVGVAAGGDHAGLQAAVSWSGPFNLAALGSAVAAAGTDYQKLSSIADPFIYLGCLPIMCPPTYAAASPAVSATPGAPPMYLANSQTELVPLAQQEEMAATLARLGVPHQTAVVAGTGHATAYAAQQTAPTLAWLSQTLGFTPPPPPAPAQLVSGPAAGGAGGLSAAQLAVANAIVGAGKGMNVPENGIIVALATAQTESGLRNLANDGTDPRLEPDQKDVSRSLQLPHDGVGHDHGSVNEFQQQYPWWGSLEELMTPAISAQKFYAKLLMVPGWAQMPVTVAAQTVQQSANPAAYAASETIARSVFAQTSGAPAIAPSVKVGDPTGGAATAGGGCPGATTGGGGAAGPIGVVVNGVTLTLPGQAGVTGTLTFPDQASATAAAAALSYLGTPYSWGGGGPGGPSTGIHDGGVADSFGDYAKAGFDCSSLMQYGYAKAGIDVTRSTGSQWESGGAGPHYAYTDAVPGDLLYYGSPTHHVAMYLGKVGDRQLMVEAPQSGDVVKVSTVRTGELVGVARPTAKAGKQ